MTGRHWSWSSPETRRRLTDPDSPPLGAAALAGFAREVCRAAVRQAQLAGAGLTFMGAADGLGGHHGLVYGTDRVVGRLENVQAVAGQGPCVSAHRTGLPTGLEDVDVATGWPMFRAEARDAGAAAVFSFPLTTPERPAGLGTLHGYRTHSGALGDVPEAAFAALADLTSQMILAQVGRSGPAGHGPPDPAHDNGLPIDL